MSDDMVSHRSEIDYLKELILNSGFPLEIEIASYLADQSTLMSDMDEISTSTHYLDKDEGKGRELDINMKISVGSEKKTSPMIFLNLLIECKKIPGNAWVFFKSPHSLYPEYQCTSLLDVLDWFPKAHVDFAHMNGLHFRKSTMTNIYDEFVLNEKQSNKLTNNLFEAATVLAKTTSYEIEAFKSSHKKMFDRFSKKDWEEYDNLNYLEIYYPIIVFDGKMYTVEEVQKGKNMTLKPTSDVALSHKYFSSNYDIGITIDVVHRKAFADLVQTIIADIEILRKALDGKIGARFREEVAKATKWYSTKGRASLSDL